MYQRVKWILRLICRSSCRNNDEQYKKKQKCHYDRRHWSHDLPEFSDDTPVLIRNGGSSNVVPGKIVNVAGPCPRSYNVETPTWLSRRNRSHLNYRPVDDVSQSVKPQSSVVMTRTRTATVMRPPGIYIGGQMYSIMTIQGFADFLRLQIFSACVLESRKQSIIQVLLTLLAL